MATRSRGEEISFGWRPTGQAPLVVGTPARRAIARPESTLQRSGGIPARRERCRGGAPRGRGARPVGHRSRHGRWMLLDSGQDCPRCEDRQADRRAQRHAVTAAVDAAMPGASETERRAATDRQLHDRVTAQGWARKHEWEQVRARQAATKAHRAEAAATRPANEVPAMSVAPVAMPAPARSPSSPLRSRSSPTPTTTRSWSSRSSPASRSWTGATASPSGSSGVLTRASVPTPSSGWSGENARTVLWPGPSVTPKTWPRPAASPRPPRSARRRLRCAGAAATRPARRRSRQGRR